MRHKLHGIVFTQFAILMVLIAMLLPQLIDGSVLIVVQWVFIILGIVTGIVGIIISMMGHRD